ncbi:MAG: glycosyltransferase family 2 protein [Gemmatimonadetes bacterium]|nr:glycosyltransferase family 2 protein [Gemmatimonadota bacterium]
MIYICIPSRNEERTIGVLLWKVRKVMLELGRDYRIIVLDDASTDGTVALLEKYKRVLPLTILQEKRPVGYGRALERLMREASNRARYPKRDAIVTMQGDFTESPDYLTTLIKTYEGGADIVAGTLEEDIVSAPRRVRLARWMAGLALRRAYADAPVGDPLCGFRAYRAVVVKKALRVVGDAPLLRRDGWAANAELMKVLTPFTRRIAEAPLGLRYDIRWRATRVKPIQTVREVLRVAKVAPLDADSAEAA